jgi:hypothetical protein
MMWITKDSVNAVELHNRWPEYDGQCWTSDGSVLSLGCCPEWVIKLEPGECRELSFEVDSDVQQLKSELSQLSTILDRCCDVVDNSGQVRGHMQFKELPRAFQEITSKYREAVLDAEDLAKCADELKNMVKVNDVYVKIPKGFEFVGFQVPKPGEKFINNRYFLKEIPEGQACYVEYPTFRRKQELVEDAYYWVRPLNRDTNTIRRYKDGWMYDGGVVQSPADSYKIIKRVEEPEE